MAKPGTTRKTDTRYVPFDNDGNRVVPNVKQKLDAVEDYWEFLEILQFHGGRRAFGQCHYDMVRWSQEHQEKRELFLLPRGHLKSTLLTVGRTLHYVYKDPNIRIFVGTATKGLALSFLREIKTYLEDPWLQENLWNVRPHAPGRLIPLMDRLGRSRRDEIDSDTDSLDKKIVWRTDQIQVLRPQILKEPTVCIGSVGMQPTGYHYDVLFLDDVINYDNIASALKYDRVLRWVKDLESVLELPTTDKSNKVVPINLSRRDPHNLRGRVCITGTRYGAMDWYSAILDPDGNQYKRYAIYQRSIYKKDVDRTSGYLWDEVWDIFYEQTKRDEIDDEFVWATQYLNQVVNDATNPIDIKRIIPLGLQWVSEPMKNTNRVAINLPTDDIERVVPLYCVVDPAASVGTTADYTAIVVGGRSADKRFFIVDGAMGRWSSSEILLQMYKLLDRWGLNAVHLETVSGFKHLSAYVRESFMKYRPIVIYEYRPLGNKEVRIANALEPLIKNDMFYLNEGLFRDPAIRNQFLFFQQSKQTDDFLDVAAVLAEISKPIGSTSRSPMLAYCNKKYGGFR
jgi:predicted phage terminase large subunit-like protein